MAEEIHDAMSTTSNILPTYNILEPSGPLYTNRDTRPVRFAMQLPETGNQPDGNGAARDFLNSFTRGNRLDDDRKSDGSAIQALSLMNDAFVMTRIRSSNTGGNRLDDDRKSDGSAIQALSLMNDAFVMTRIRSSNTGGQQSLLNRFINMADTQLVNQLYLTVLSRYPSQAEADIAIATLRGTSGTTRTQRGENLLWSLYNKVDFIYNY